ncbi:MAG: UDP-N-acetylenolpyruvoylglucosamine reductase, partial [Acidobacteria bacterium]
LPEVRAAVRAIRASKSMLLQPGDPDAASAGSFFKNPVVTEAEFLEIEEVARRAGVIERDQGLPRFPAHPGSVKVPAAWLIERAGFSKGYARGRAAVSAHHTLALVNRGGATAEEVLTLAREIEETVSARFGVMLRPEPVFVGF